MRYRQNTGELEWVCVPETFRERISSAWRVLTGYSATAITFKNADKERQFMTSLHRIRDIIDSSIDTDAPTQ